MFDRKNTKRPRLTILTQTEHREFLHFPYQAFLHPVMLTETIPSETGVTIRWDSIALG
jgi:hypothetical protein